MALFNFSINALPNQLTRNYGINVKWTNENNVVILQSTGLPLHSFGVNNPTITPTIQNYYVAIPYMGGTNESGSHFDLPQGPIGYWLNGVAIYGPAAVGTKPKGYPTAPEGYTYNRSFKEPDTLVYDFDEDAAGGFASLNPSGFGGDYHYTGFTFADAWTTGVGHLAGSSTSTGVAEIAFISYLSGSLTHEDGHSKIIGLSLDGFPIYGPYGYSDANDASSAVVKMSSGYTLKDPSTREGLAANISQYPMGIFVEDFEYVGLADLDQFNGRFCVTPDFPLGTYAYFATVDVDDNPVYPYIVGPQYYGTPSELEPPAPPTTNTQPIWRTKAGLLGKISAQEYFVLDLLAEAPNNIGTIRYDLVAGQLPRGLRLDPTGSLGGNPEKIFTLGGVPFDVNQDITSEFTVRATNLFDNSITDRTFSIVVTGNFEPQIITLGDPLGVYLDGTEVELQLEALDLNNDPLTWRITKGELPPGLSLSSNGLISGIIQPYIYPLSDSIVGWDNSKWDRNDWEFTTRSSNKIYNFTVSVTDGKSTKNRRYKITVFSHNDVRADNTAITADSINITADANQDRPPILITKTLGDFSVVNSGGYYAFKFDAIDYDSSPITYSISAADELGWDGNSSWDVGIFDRSNFELPPGLSLDPVTGWLTGYIPPQAQTTKDYTFGIYVSSSDTYKLGTTFDNKTTIFDRSETSFSTQTSITSPMRLFTLTVLGNLDLAVTWVTDNNLGTITAGKTSNLTVEAVALSGRELTYSLKNGSKLPQGLRLLPDGTISGRVSFQTMGFDRGTTTFDKELKAKFVYDNFTNFDNVFEFTVIANDFANQISAEQTFTIRVETAGYEPYENLYIRCMPDVPQRRQLQQLLFNTDIFDPTDIYRPTDPYYGIQPELRFLLSYGIKASKLSQYVEAMQDRFFKKPFYFGEYKIAQGKDVNGTVLYDVLYVELLENTKAYEVTNGFRTAKIPAAFTNINTTKSKWRNPRAAYLPQNQLTSDTTNATADIQYVRTNNDWWLLEALNVISPNDLTLMQKDISVKLENSNLNSLPEWMISVQDNGRILGYTSAAVLAYLKPGTGAKALYNVKRYAPFDIKTIPFIADRLVVNNSYTNNFDLDKRRFFTSRYTTFDQSSRRSTTIVPVTTVDFAVNRPLDSIDGKTLEYVNATGGFDGITYNLNNKLFIFASQEAFTGWGSLANDGWNKYQGGIIPGYQEKLNISTLTNQRGGVWRINVSNDNLITLTFVREINPGEYVAVRDGATNANSYQLYDIAALTYGYTVPVYKLVMSAVTIPRKETTFDSSSTIFRNNVDPYTLPFSGDKYIAFPKIGVFTNGQ